MHASLIHSTGRGPHAPTYISVSLQSITLSVHDPYTRMCLSTNCFSGEVVVELVLRESLWTGGVKTSVYAIWLIVVHGQMSGGVCLWQRGFQHSQGLQITRVLPVKLLQGCVVGGHSRCNHGIRNVLYIGLHVQSTTFSSGVFRVAL